MKLTKEEADKIERRIKAAKRKKKPTIKTSFKQFLRKRGDEVCRILVRTNFCF
jgi:hypothetical protein